MPDPKDLWQSQSTEETNMTMALIHRRASELRDRTRLELVTHLALAGVVTGLALWGIPRTEETGLRLMFALATGWAIVGQYFLNRGIWGGSIAGGKSGVEFYRQELERRLSLLGRILQWMFGPMVLAVVAFILVIGAKAQGQIRLMAPFCVLFVVWMAAVIVQRQRGQGALRQEAEELERLSGS